MESATRPAPQLPLKRREIRYLEVLERRNQHIKKRIEERVDIRGASYDKHEAAALDWAIGFILQTLGLPSTITPATIPE